VLSQVHLDGNEYPIAFASRSCNSHERNYASYKGEMAAAVWAVDYFRMYLLGQAFTLVTDHQPLAFLMRSQKLAGVYARWACRLQEYDITIAYRPGAANANADGISRFPLPSSDADWEVFREELDYYWQKGDQAGGAMEPPALPQRSAPLVACAAMAASLSQFPQPTRSMQWLVAALQPSDGLVDIGELDVHAAPLLRQYDIHTDLAAMDYLAAQGVSANIGEQERRRVLQRVAGYRLVPLPAGGAVLYRRMPRAEEGGAAELVVPAPERRRELILQAHGLSHHRLVKTYSLLQTHYWWYGMKLNVKVVIQSCPSCLRQMAAASRPLPILTSLPILGLGFSLHIDLGGDFVDSNGFKYFLVVVDRASKYLVAEPLPNKTARVVAAAFSKCWLWTWGSPGEIVHDQGKEFQGEFAELMLEHSIDVRETAPNTPQSNGQAEIYVKDVKSALTRCINALPNQDRAEWSSLLPRIVMSHNASRQGSIGMSPFFLITGRNPVLPFVAEHVFSVPAVLDLESIGPDTLAAILSERAAVLKRHNVLALGNIAIAQKRQSMYYALHRSGVWLRPSQLIREGDAAVLVVESRTNLDIPTTSDPLRVIQARPHGTLVLQGCCGGIQKDNHKHWAPFHHSSAIPLIDVELVRDRLGQWLDDGAATCWICDESTSDMDPVVERTDPDKNYTMVQCSLCGNYLHLSCLELSTVPPEDDWRCPTCLRFWLNPLGETFYEN
jgi:hypothetical protein